MVMGCLLTLTELAPGLPTGAGSIFYDIHEARIAHSDSQIDLRAPITGAQRAGHVRKDRDHDGVA